MIILKKDIERAISELNQNKGKAMKEREALLTLQYNPHLKEQLIKEIEEQKSKKANHA